MSLYHAPSPDIVAALRGLTRDHLVHVVAYVVERNMALIDRGRLLTDAARHARQQEHWRAYDRYLAEYDAVPVSVPGESLAAAMLRRTEKKRLDRLAQKHWKAADALWTGSAARVKT